MQSACSSIAPCSLVGLHTSEPDLGAIVEIRRRLDGLPLAIELAAARTRVLTPEAILRRSEPVDVSERRTARSTEAPRTLRDTIRWSYDLLEPAEMLAVRVPGGVCRRRSLEAAEALRRPNNARTSSASWPR